MSVVRLVRLVSAVVAGAWLLSALACKETESLVVFDIKTATTDTTLTSLEITVGGASGKVTKTFTFTGGLMMTTGKKFGVYVPSSIVGSTVPVTIVALRGPTCGGFSNRTQSVSIAKAGDLVNKAVTLDADPNACPSTGTGGTGGGGGQVIPSLGRCVEYDHNDPSSPVCDDEAGISNWTVWSVAFSPNGRLFASSADDGRVKIWNFDGRSLTAEGHVLVPPGAVYSIAFSPDGSTLAVAHDFGVDLFSTSTWGMSGLLSGVTAQGLDVAWDGNSVMTVDGSGTLWRHAANGALQTSLMLPANGYSVAASPANAGTVAVSYTNGSAQLFSASANLITAGASFVVTTDGTTARTVRFSPDGTLLAAGGADGLLNFWKVPLTDTNPTGADIAFINGTAIQAVNMVAFHPTGKYVGVATGERGNGGSGSIWDVTARSSKGRFIGAWYMTAAAFSPDGKALALGEVTCGKVALCAD